MQTILCFGDSNTWGSTTDDTGRYPWPIRWPGVLQQTLGSSYRVIEEGLCGRTNCFDDPFEAGRNGRSYLPIVLETHSPIDLLIIMLGTNDVKKCFGLSALEIAQGAAELLDFATKFQPKIPNILLISPPHIVPTKHVENTLAFEGAIEKSKELAQHYKHFAKEYGCNFLDASSVIKSSTEDGIHLEAQAHTDLGLCISTEIKKIFSVTSH